MQDFSISVDDNMVYQGRLRKAPPSAVEMPPNGFGQTVLFTNDVDVVQKEKGNVYCMDDDGDSNIQFLEGSEGEKNVVVK